MVKITGNLHIDTGFIRIKPNINFIGAVQGMVVYDLSDLTEIELTPTPIEGVYLVDYAPDSNAPFLPSEHWIVPSKDCTFDEVRGIKNPDDLVEKLKAETAELSKQIIQLSLENAQLTLDNVEYQKQVTKVEEILKSTNPETDIEAETTKNNTSLNILSRFKDPAVSEVKRIKNPDPHVVKLEEQITELKTENSELILQKHNHLNQIEWLNVQLNNTKQQNELATKSLGEMLSKARSENLELTSRNADYLNQIEWLNVQLTTIKEQNELAIQSLRELLSQSTSENLELTSRNADYLNQVESLTTQLEDTKKQNQGYLNQVESLTTQLEDTKQQNAGYLNQAESLTTQLEDTKKQNELAIQSLRELLSQSTLENLELTSQNTDYLNQIRAIEQAREQTITSNNQVADLEESETTKTSTSLNILSRFK